MTFEEKLTHSKRSSAAHVREALKAYERMRESLRKERVREELAERRLNR